MVKVTKVSKNYGERIALKNVSFSVQKGEVLGLLGPNGAGKSTTMKIMTGFMSPTQGSVLIDGINIFEKPLEAKKLIGYLPETPPLYTDMYVEDYLFYVCRLKKVNPELQAVNVQRALNKTQLSSVRKRLISNLSKGFRQRVGLAQAIVSDPQILILDEPTVGLDPQQVSEIRDLIRELKGEHTVILSTHILSEVEAVCDRVVILNHGQIVAQEKISNIHSLTQAQSTLRLKLRKPIVELGDIESIAGVRQVLKLADLIFEIKIDSTIDVTDQIAKLVLKKDAGLVEISQVESQLEELFLDLTYPKDKKIDPLSESKILQEIK